MLCNDDSVDGVSGRSRWRRAIISNIPRVQFAKGCNNADVMHRRTKTKTARKKGCVRNGSDLIN